MAKRGAAPPEIFPVAAIGAATAALRDLLDSAPRGARNRAAPFAAALAAVHPPAAVAPPPHRLPVCRHLPAALHAASGTPAQALVPALAELVGHAHWTQNPHYRGQPPAAGFLDAYGYFVLAGPADGPPAFVECPGLACGVLLLGPGTLYPAHRHPAAELYVPLAGDAAWQRGDDDWRDEPAGAVIHHAPGVSHAMRAGPGPLLAIYLWMGELAIHARLSPAAG